MAYIDSYGVEYSDDRKILVKCPSSLEGSYTVLQGTTIIGEKAFEGCEKITEVNLPDSIKEINPLSFFKCKTITSFSIPENVEHVGKCAFRLCDALSEVIIRSNYVSMAKDAFLGCNGIRKLSIPSGFIIREFFDSDYVNEVSVTEGSTVIDEDMFECCDALTTICIPSSVNEIQDSAFSDCKKLNTIDVDSASQFFTLHNNALFNKDKTELLLVPRNFVGSFLIPDTVIKVADYAFNDCKKIETITISDNVKDLPLIWGCDNLKAFIVNDNDNYSTLDGVLYSHSKASLIRCPEGVKGDFVIPSFVNCIKSNAFYNCHQISSITIPEGVTSIDGGAFWLCDGLKEIFVPGSVCSIGRKVFPRSVSQIRVAKENENYYSDGKLLITQKWPSVVFACKDIEGDFIIPENIICIKQRAFEDCEELTSIALPHSLKRIEKSGFYGCKKLERVEFNDGLEVIEPYSFGDCGQLKDISLPNSVKTFEKAFYDFYIRHLALPSACQTVSLKTWHCLKSVSLNDGFEIINKDLLKGCFVLTDLTIPASVKTVEANALDDCKALKNIHYEGTLKEWLAMKWPCVVKNGYNLYIQGELLTDVALDGSVSEIRENAFYYCNSLQHVEIREGVEKIGASAFNKTSIIGDVYLPDSVKSIGEYAFLSCKKLTSISIPHISWGIGSGILRYCDSLEKVDIRGKKEGEGDDFFTIDGVVFQSKVVLHMDGTTKEGGHWFKNVFGTVLYHYPCNKKASRYIIPKEVESIEDYAFTGVNNLTLVFREYLPCKKNTFLNAKVKILVPTDTKQQFIQNGYPQEAIKEIDVEIYLNRGIINEKCSCLVSNNPYRLLGVFADASLKEITANKTKAARYASVGKTVSFEADFDSLLSPMNRTAENIEKAFADLSLPQDKIKYALTWFVKGSSIDEIAINHIKSDNYEKALEILEKKETWSSLLNQGVLALARKDAERAVAVITKMIHEEEYRNAFAESICGDSFKIDEDELAHIFIDLLMDGNETPALLEIFEQNGEAAEDDVYIKKRLTEAPVGRIKAAVAKAKNIDPNDSVASYSAGKTLMDDTKADLRKLKSLCGDDAIYGMMADSLAKQILQCGINYYNESFDDQYERLDKAKELQEYALSIAEGSIIKERCKENVDILHSIQEKLPPKEVKKYFDAIIDKLDRFEKTLEEYKPSFNKSIKEQVSDKFKYMSSAVSLIEDCARDLVAIKESLGVSNEHYLSISTAIANTALGATIEGVNSVHKEFDIARSVIIESTLSQGWRTMLYIEKLDLEHEFKYGRYKENRDILKGLIERLHGFKPGLYGSTNVFGLPLIINLDLRTDDEFFKTCKTKFEHITYLTRFPKGKHIAQVRQKLVEFEKEAWNKCKTVYDFRNYLKDYPYGIYCKEAKEKIDQLEEEASWVDSKNDDTIEAYNNYLTSTKLSKYTQEARLAIERLKEEHRKDEEMWKGCQKKQDFEKYLQAFPRALHKVEANERIEKFERQKRNLIIACVVLGLGVVITLAVVFGG